MKDRIRTIEVDDEWLRVTTVTGRRVAAPLRFLSERLFYATATQRAHYRVIGGGLGLNWPDCDEDISLEGLLKNFES